MGLRGWAFAAALAVAAAGCQALGGSAPDLPAPAGWVRSDPFEASDVLLVWEACKSRAARDGFRIDDDATTFRGRRVVTLWNTQLATTGNEGRRRRRFVEILDEEGRAGWYRVQAAVVVQRNEDVDDPLNPVSAKWREEAPDLEEAERLSYVIAARFRDYGPSREFEER